MDRYAIKVVSLWVFTGQFFQIFCMFEKFHNKILCGGEAANNLALDCELSENRDLWLAYDC